ncbi:hypothetical protein CIPAW_10G000300 [Carya illinoinensis]|uniref:Secreted protein n=1 Tax=Carya illinoinensis TaxID=32201 RepID=A0A8T1P821_CARIL|nr:hypothetical protein CIPAW_10G000300 [Carya illinoinensis]
MRTYLRLMSFLHLSIMYFSGNTWTSLAANIESMCLHIIPLISNNPHMHFASHSSSLKYACTVDFLMPSSTCRLSLT